MIEQGTRYICVSPKGDKSIVTVSSNEQVAYHNRLIKDGFKYKEVIPAQVVGSTCVSCEG